VAVPWERGTPAPSAALERRHNPPTERPNRKKGTLGTAQGSRPQAQAAATPLTEAPDVPQVRAAKIAETEKPQAQPESREENSKRPAGLVLQVSELPSAVRSALPQFRISGHAYSPEPQTRVARINEKILQEGQELAPGLRLEEIVPDGVIFGYRGYRFRVDLNGSR